MCSAFSHAQAWFDEEYYRCCMIMAKSAVPNLPLREDFTAESERRKVMGFLSSSAFLSFLQVPRRSRDKQGSGYSCGRMSVRGGETMRAVRSDAQKDRETGHVRIRV